MSRWISLVVLLAIIAITAAILYKVMAGFVLPLFLASVLAVIFRPVHNWMLRKCNRRSATAAALTTLVILVTVLVPVGAIFTFAVREGVGAIGGNMLDQAQGQFDRIRRKLHLDVPFRRLPAVDQDDEEDIFLSDVDRHIAQLPDQWPANGQFTPEALDRMAQIEEALSRMEAALKIRLRLVPEDEDTSDDSAEMRCARRLRREDLDDQVIESINRLRSTLQWAYRYGKAEDKDGILAEEQPMMSLDGPSESESDAENEDDVSNGSAKDAEPADDQDRPPTLRELRSRLGGFKSQYEALRIDMLGGPMWAGIVHLANPDVDQIESWRLSVQRYLRGWLPSVAGQATALVGSFLLGLAIMTLSVFYFLKDGPAMVQSLMKLSPLDDRYERELLIEFDKVSRAVVLATLLSAVAQGLLASIAYLLAGFESVFLLTSLTIVFAMVPFVGAAAVWLPAVLWLGLVDERLIAALVMLVYCFGVVSMVDNVIKPFVLHGQSKLHPLLALLSVLGGVQALGPIGILVGPMIVSFLQALLNILHQEMQQLDMKSA